MPWSGHTARHTEIHTVKYYYACALHDEGSRDERAFELIDEIRPLYENAPSLDTHFLLVRGVNPSFFQYLDYAVRISSKLEHHDTSAWLWELRQNVNDKEEGQAAIMICANKHGLIVRDKKPEA